MPTPGLPSTPVAQSMQPTPSTPITGTWRHPQLDQIVTRQNAANFTASNVKKIAYNVGGLSVVFATARGLWTFLPSLFHQGKVLNPYANFAYYALQLLFLYNIVIACMPLLRTVDDVSDIPLTPAQRKLLGLPPSSAPPTPGSQYVTPPRYARTTPVGGSPLSAKGSPNSSTTGLNFSPNSSPLLQKAMGGGMNGTRRASHGSPSPLGPSLRGGPETPGSPCPVSRTGGLGLNNKWLYDKGRRNSGSSRLYS